MYKRPKEASHIQAANKEIEDLQKLDEAFSEAMDPASPPKKAKPKTPLIGSIREKIDSVKKSKMRTIQQYLCDSCDEVIPYSSDDECNGFIIQGNIYVSNADERGGIVGNHFPEPEEDGKIKVSDIREEVLCRDCLVSILGLTNLVKSKKKV
jgi:hypothetical protein